MEFPAFCRHPARTGYLWALPGTLAATLLLGSARHTFDLTNVGQIYVLGVVLLAARFGRGPAVAGALASALCYAYVFVPPHFSLAITEAQYLMTALIMLVVALIVSHLTSRLKQHADFAQRKSQESATLYGLARKLAGASTPAAVIESARQFLAESCAAREIQVFSAVDRSDAAAEARPALIDECLRRNTLLTRPTGEGRFYTLVPLTAASGVQGVLGFEVAATALTSQDAVEYLETAASVIAVALERSHFADKARDTEVKHAAESLRSSILAALSHDLRTPLTALVSQAETAALGKLSPERQRLLLNAIRQQALSISQQMTQLLDMARLSVGPVQLDTAWQPVEEVLGVTARQIRAQWPERVVSIELAPDLPPVKIDAVLIERVLWNLAENAIKYSPPETPVALAATRDGNDLDLAVCDHGPGIPPAIAEKIFAPFQRGKPESGIPGIGLGLSIARTIVEAHGGQLLHRSGSPGGCCFHVRLPIGNPPSLHDIDPGA